MTSNSLTEVPPDLAQLAPTLTQLDVSRNPISTLPPFITSLTKLELLNFGNTLIREMPQNIGDLTDLRIIDLKITLIHKLPDSFAKLKVR